MKNSAVGLLVALWSRVAGARSRDTGATATEYAILAGFIAIVILAGVALLGANLNDWYSTLAAQLP